MCIQEDEDEDSPIDDLYNKKMRFQDETFNFSNNNHYSNNQTDLFRRKFNSSSQLQSPHNKKIKKSSFKSDIANRETNKLSCKNMNFNENPLVCQKVNRSNSYQDSIDISDKNQPSVLNKKTGFSNSSNDISLLHQCSLSQTSSNNYKSDFYRPNKDLILTNKGNVNYNGGVSYDTLINCKDSTNCKDDVSCKDSLNCKDDVSCKDSVNCKDSVSCKDSVNCKDSVSCKDSVNYKDSVSCKDDVNCKDSVSCKDDVGFLSDHTVVLNLKSNEFITRIKNKLPQKDNTQITHNKKEKIPEETQNIYKKMKAWEKDLNEVRFFFVKTKNRLIQKASPI